MTDVMQKPFRVVWQKDAKSMVEFQDFETIDEARRFFFTFKVQNHTATYELPPYIIDRNGD